MVSHAAFIPVDDYSLCLLVFGNLCGETLHFMVFLLDEFTMLTDLSVDLGELLLVA